MKPRFPWKRTLLAAIIAVSAVSALGYTYSIKREDIGKIMFPSTATIIPTDSPVRSMQGVYSDCGFSPNPCVGTIPEPGTWALMGIGFFMLLVIRRNRNAL